MLFAIALVPFLAALLLGAALLVFALVSAREGEPRAVGVALALALAAGLLGMGSLVAEPATRLWLAGGIGLLMVALFVIGLLPVGRSIALGGNPTRRVDERTIMFARRRMIPGSPEFLKYYQMHPEHQEDDDKTRVLPGLLSPQAQRAELVAFAAARASFAVTEALRDAVDGPVGRDRVDLPTDDATAMVKQLALYYGAVAVGVTRLRPYHIYSHVGRGSGSWGEAVTLEHRWAIAFTVEMDHGVMRAAPEAPVVAESARQYVAGAQIAIQLASAIRGLGHPARAHIDGNYRVIAPLVGRDAGLGEIGRMGLLMTPRLGPRVRLGVVTTDLTLRPDPSGEDPAMLDFCTICKKCAENCPSRSIPHGEREPIDSAQRWAIDADSCFRYWNAIGTDCARCMTVCPYSHPDNAAHNLVRGLIRRSGAGRRAMLWMDDLFYGRRPAARAARSPFERSSSG